MYKYINLTFSNSDINIKLTWKKITFIVIRRHLSGHVKHTYTQRWILTTVIRNRSVHKIRLKMIICRLKKYPFRCNSLPPLGNYFTERMCSHSLVTRNEMNRFDPVSNSAPPYGVSVDLTANALSCPTLYPVATSFEWGLEVSRMFIYFPSFACLHFVLFPADGRGEEGGEGEGKGRRQWDAACVILCYLFCGVSHVHRPSSRVQNIFLL